MKESVFHSAQIKRSSFEPSRGVHVEFNQCLLKHGLRNRRSFPKAHEGNETASEYGGAKKPFLPTPLPLLLAFLTPSTSSHFLLTQGALVCSLVCLSPPPGKWKGTSAIQAN